MVQKIELVFLGIIAVCGFICQTTVHVTERGDIIPAGLALGSGY